MNNTLATEVAELALRYGEPRRVAVVLAGLPFSPMSELDRIGEVCMVVRRRNGKLLTAIKTFYPEGAFRLLTGGINHGEAIEAALLRETWEETGLEVVVRQFLAVIEYRLAENAAKSEADFITFAFLLDETGGVLAAQDPNEQLAAYRELPVDELPALADTLENLTKQFNSEIEGHWNHWGQFRAVVHRVVAEILHDQP